MSVECKSEAAMDCDDENDERPVCRVLNDVNMMETDSLTKRIGKLFQRQGYSALLVSKIENYKNIKIKFFSVFSFRN